MRYLAIIGLSFSLIIFPTITDAQEICEEMYCKYYVDASTPTGGNGSLASPYNTITEAITNAQLKPLVLIIVKKGIYQEPSITLPENFYLITETAQTSFNTQIELSASPGIMS